MHSETKTGSGIVEKSVTELLLGVHFIFEMVIALVTNRKHVKTMKFKVTSSSNCIIDNLDRLHTKREQTGSKIDSSQ